MLNHLAAYRTALSVSSWFSEMKDRLYTNFIAEDRYMYLLKGLWMTLRITFLAVLLGIALGVVAAIVRSTHDKTIADMRPGFGKILLKILDALVKLYLTVIRGTPVVVQLMITYYIIFASSTNQMLVAVLAFGINSGAYVAEIIRSGIMSIDNGQFEAGRSLGFNYIQTMIYIIIPQAIKNVLPALANEIVTMVKESSICSMLGMAELMFGAKAVASSTYITLAPYTMAALIYFCINYPASKAIEAIERRMRRGDKQ